MSMTAARRRDRFTLIELLVVVSIISILAAMLLPALSKARGKVRTTVCVTSMRNLAQITDLYVEDTDGFLPRGVLGGGNTGNPTMWADLGARLAAKFPQFQVPQASAGMSGGYEARLMLGDYIYPDDASDYLRCPSDPRMDWLPGQSTIPAASVIDPTGTPTVTYESAACWAPNSTGGGSYLGLQRHTAAPFRKSALEGSDADKELYYIHSGGSYSSLLFHRGSGWGWGSWSGNGLPTEYHPSRVPPGTVLTPGDPTQLTRTDGVPVFNAGGTIAYNDIAGWKNPYVFFDEHVEIADSIWANPSWHQPHHMLEWGNWSPLPGDVSRATYTLGARTRAQNAH